MNTLTVQNIACHVCTMYNCTYIDVYHCMSIIVFCRTRSRRRNKNNEHYDIWLVFDNSFYLIKDILRIIYKIFSFGVIWQNCLIGVKRIRSMETRNGWKKMFVFRLNSIWKGEMAYAFRHNLYSDCWRWSLNITSVNMLSWGINRLVLSI